MKKLFAIQCSMALIALMFLASCEKETLTDNRHTAETLATSDKPGEDSAQTPKRVWIEEIGPVQGIPRRCAYAVYTDEWPGDEGSMHFVGIVTGPCGITFGNFSVAPTEDLGQQISALYPRANLSAVEARPQSPMTVEIAKRATVYINGYTFTFENRTCASLLAEWNNGGITVSSNGDFLPNNGNYTWKMCTESNGTTTVTFGSEVK